MCFDHQSYRRLSLAIPRAELERKYVALNARGREREPAQFYAGKGRGGERRKGEAKRKREERGERTTRTSHPPSSLPSLLCSACPLFSLAPEYQTQLHITSLRLQSKTTATPSAAPSLRDRFRCRHHHHNKYTQHTSSHTYSHTHVQYRVAPTQSVGAFPALPSLFNHLIGCRGVYGLDG